MEQVINVGDWSEIRVLARREGLSHGEIACRLGISWLVVKRTLDLQGPPG
jgi:DNA-binding transcriptional regulator LsrR (DeoR family)